MAFIGKDISQAASILKANNLVAIPTETVYGLAGNALQEEAILKIYAAKNRPKFDPLIAHIGHIDQLQSLVTHVPDKAKKLADAFWPGPLTLLLPRASHVPDLLTSGLPRVAVRMPNHVLTLALLQQLDFPLAAPSANPFGYVSPTSAQHVNAQLGDKIEHILDGGECEIGLESTIVGFDGEDAIIHRLGGLSIEAIEKVIGTTTSQLNKSSNPDAPGMLKSHYSPGIPIKIGRIDEEIAQLQNQRYATLSFSTNYPSAHSIVLSPSGNVDEAAQHLFGALRTLATSSVDIILTEKFPDVGLGRAINDRLERAAAQ